MPRIPNAFKFRAGDAPVIDTGLFLHLYVPSLLKEWLKSEDFHAPKLLIVRGSPGSGKSSMLRLFQVETLLALHTRSTQPSEQSIIERLRELGVWSDNGPLAVGIYLQCDSSLRDLANVDVNNANMRLLNTLLDMRIALAFLRSLKHLSAAGLAPSDVDKVALTSLSPDESPPPLFSSDKSVRQLRDECERMEADFATLLSSFPGDPIPPSIRPHSRVFAVPFLAEQVRAGGPLSGLIPMIMLDNLQDLYETQREQVKNELLRRAAIPRWISVRKHVFELEDLIPLSGAKEDRDYRIVDLDTSPPGDFKKFVSIVADRRWRQSDGLRSSSTLGLKDALAEDEAPVADRKRVEREVPLVVKRLNALGVKVELTDLLGVGASASPVPFERLLSLERRLILAERKANRGELMLIDVAPDEPSDAKTEEAVKLFAARRYGLSYYHSFETLVEASNGNVEQFLSIAAAFADKLIFRAELGREPTLSPQEQNAVLRRSGEAYSARIEQRYEMGYTIRTLVENLGQFFEAVTYRPKASYAPGVNGFGFTRDQLRQIVAGKSDPHIAELATVLTRAVAENVFFVRQTKQGAAGTEKFVFYLNRLLCVKYSLPLGLGGWQYIPIKTLTKMVLGPVPAKDWGKKWTSEPVWIDVAE